MPHRKTISSRSASVTANRESPPAIIGDRRSGSCSAAAAADHAGMITSIALAAAVCIASAAATVPSTQPATRPTTRPLDSITLDYETSVDAALQAKVEVIDAELRQQFGMTAEQTAVGVFDLNTGR